MIVTYLIEKVNWKVTTWNFTQKMINVKKFSVIKKQVIFFLDSEVYP